MSCSSTSEASEGDLKILTCVGILARYALGALGEIDEWKELIGLMDESVEFKKCNIRELSKQCSELRNQIEKIKRDKEEEKKQDIFKSGKVEFNKNINFLTGNGRYDYVTSTKYSWIPNPGDKTYKLFFEDRRQSGWDPELGDYKNKEVFTSNVGKRIREVDLRRFIIINMGSIGKVEEKVKEI